MSTNTLFTIEMSFPFNFRLSVPGISNPFAAGPVQHRIQSQNRNQQGPETVSPARPGCSSVPAYRRHHPSRSSPPVASRKRRWVPAATEISPARTISTSTTGFLDTPAKYRDMCGIPLEQGACEEVAVDLPPAKRRKGIADSVISTAFSAALIGAAVGLTVYRMWRDKGRDGEQTPPPPYQEEWVDPSRKPTTPLITPESSSTLSPSQKLRTTPASHKRHSSSVRHRTKNAKRPARLLGDMSPQKYGSAEVGLGMSMDQSAEDDQKDEMDWVGDRLAQLIEEGKRALGREVVVASEATDDEMDDGSGDWVEDDAMRDPDLGGPSKRFRHQSSYSVPHTNITPRRTNYNRHPFFGSEDIRASTVNIPSTPNTMRDRPDGHTPSASCNLDSEWSSPQVKESMERARAAYRLRRGLDS